MSMLAWLVRKVLALLMIVITFKEHDESSRSITKPSLKHPDLPFRIIRRLALVF